jgi:PiT family inorganic phosphate transporter
MARGIEAIDLRVVARILVSWVVTIPAGAFLAILFFFLFRAVLP